MSEENQEVEIISLESLMDGPIDETPNEAKAKAEEALADALEGKVESDDLTDQFIKDSKLEEETEEEEEGKLKVDKPEEEEEVATKDGNIYRDAIKELFGEDQMFIQEGEDGEDIEVGIDDLEATPETLKELIQAKIDSEKEKALEGKVSLEGTSELIRDLIDIDKNGGDIRDLLQYREAYTDPLDKLDLSNERDQEKAVELYLRGRNESEDEIEMRIEIYKKKGILGEKAEEFNSKIRESIKGLIEQRKQQAQAYAAEREEMFKQYRKDLGEELKNKFEISDSVRRKLVDGATKKGEDGEYEIDKLYKAARGNPEEVALLSLFFENREEFIRQLSKEKVRDQRLKDQKAIKLGSSSRGYEGKKKEKVKEDKSIISFESLL